MNEKKAVGRNVVITLGIICIILAIGLVGAITNYTLIINGKDSTIASLNSQITDKDNAIASLNSQIANLQNQISDLNASYTWLKHHSFTYYVVGNAINISNVGIFLESEWLSCYTINGTITNIGDKPIKEVYVYLILRNPDGTTDFNPYDYDKIENLYMGESETFEFTWITIEEGQTVEIFLVY